MTHRGFSHIGLSTLDLDKTRAFYEGVLGFKPVVADTITIEEGGHLRHMFFDVGSGQLIAFLEPNGVPDVPAKYDAGINRGLGVPAGFYHFAFEAGSAAALAQKRDELRGKGVETTDIVDHGSAQSIYFKDPNGISLEYCCLIGNRPETGALKHSEFTLPRAALELTDALAKARSPGGTRKDYCPNRQTAARTIESAPPDVEIQHMPNQIERALSGLDRRLPGRVSLPGGDGYAAATAIWPKPVCPTPRAVVHCRTTEDVQVSIAIARDCGLPLSVRGGGHHWASLALCAGIVIDLSGMNGVSVAADHRSAIISGGSRAADVAAATDPLHLAAVTGACGAVGMAGFTLGGGYGPLIGRCGLALDNLLTAQVVLADGRVVVADDNNEQELFWALRGGGGNFGVVAAMRHRLHNLPSFRSGMLVYSFAEARAVLRRCGDIAASSPEDLTVQIGCAGGPDGKPVVMILPAWCGPRAEGEAQVAPFLKLGTLLAGNLEAMSYGTSLTLFDPYIVNGQRVFMDTCWLPALDTGSIDAFIQAMETVVSPGCALFTHEFKGAASRVPAEATAFGLRRDHVLVEILATFVDGSDKEEEQRHRRWARATRHAFAPMALPGGYPNFLVADDAERAAKSYGRNAERLIRAKRHYDPDNIFRSAIPLPVSQSTLAGVTASL